MFRVMIVEGELQLLQGDLIRLNGVMMIVYTQRKRGYHVDLNHEHWRSTAGAAVDDYIEDFERKHQEDFKSLKQNLFEMAKKLK